MTSPNDDKKTCERGQVSGLDSLFIRNFEGLIFDPPAKFSFLSGIKLLFSSVFWFGIELFGAMTENG